MLDQDRLQKIADEAAEFEKFHGELLVHGPGVCVIAPPTHCSCDHTVMLRDEDQICDRCGLIQEARRP